MRCRNAIWFSSALAMVLAATPALAFAAQQKNGQKAPPPSTANPPKVQPPPPFMDLNGKDAQRTIPGAYRLTYTLTEMDGDKRVGSRHYALVLDADAPQSYLNSGTRIPIETGAPATDSSPAQTQVTYIDIGVRIRSRLRQFANGMELNSHIDQSTVESSQPHPLTPVIRQTTIDNTILLTEGEPVVIGKAGIPGSTHSLETQVVLTRVR